MNKNNLEIEKVFFLQFRIKNKKFFRSHAFLHKIILIGDGGHKKLFCRIFIQNMHMNFFLCRSTQMHEKQQNFIKL